MKIIKSLAGVLFIVAATAFTPIARAEPTLDTQQNVDETISDKFYRATFRNQPDYYGNRSAGSFLNLLFGINGYPENQFTQDGREVERLYRATLQQQNSSDPLLRTPDLPNPYESSIISSPNLSVYQRLRMNQ